MLLEELEDVLRGLRECGVTGGTVRQDSNPDHYATGDCPSATICVLLIPPEVGKVNRGMLDFSIVKEFNNLGTMIDYFVTSCIMFWAGVLLDSTTSDTTFLESSQDILQLLKQHNRCSMGFRWAGHFRGIMLLSENHLYASLEVCFV